MNWGAQRLRKRRGSIRPACRPRGFRGSAVSTQRSSCRASHPSRMPRRWAALASVSTSWFPGFGGFNAKIELQGKPSLTDAQAVGCLVSAHEFLTLRIPLLAGRLYYEDENMRAPHLAGG